MRTFKGTVKTNKERSDVNFEFMVDDEATDDEILEAGQDAIFESGSAEWWYEEVTE